MEVKHKITLKKYAGVYLATLEVALPQSFIELFASGNEPFYIMEEDLDYPWGDEFSPGFSSREEYVYGLTKWDAQVQAQKRLETIQNQIKVLAKLKGVVN